MNGIDEAVAVLARRAGGPERGGMSELARILGVSPQAVRPWVKRGFAPLDRVVEIEEATGVSRWELADPRIKQTFANTLDAFAAVGGAQ